MCGRATVSDDDEVLALDVDIVVPLSRMEDGTVEFFRVERRVVRNTQTTETRDENVASSSPDLLRLDVSDRECPESGLAGESSLFDSGSENDVIEVALFFDAVKVVENLSLSGPLSRNVGSGAERERIKRDWNIACSSRIPVEVPSSTDIAALFAIKTSSYQRKQIETGRRGEDSLHNHVVKSHLLLHLNRRCHTG